MKEKRFVLELNEKQLQLVKDSLEEYFRVRMGQWWDLADSIASQNVDLSPENPNHDEIFRDYITHRDCGRAVMECAGKILCGNRNQLKTEDQLICEDIWRVIRYRLYLESGSTDATRVDAYPPTLVSDEPKPICEVKK